ncbi:phospholipid-binding protein [Tieghemostelium lacteum]|uniref:Phospholipid-binding protein n=1 Tax=Tieghemostelium lacteum TaxID=361077 RepID=A0A151ZHZ9_TIELA|nr:phospholipid-binding protein [Tieghemostelium lacteum]|eukprot:KYQ93593.1 phospholipid-binding protein [Tieghemostelium lacteum]
MTTPNIPKPTSKVELRFTCTKLKDLDVFSKSDPMVLVYAQDPRTQSWNKIGQTEMVKNNLSPQFKTPVRMDYYFEEVQNLRFTVIDVDNADHLDKIQEQDMIGETTTTLSNILSRAGQTLETDLLDKSKKFSGKIRVSCEELKSTNQTLRIRLGCSHLDKKDLFGKTDCYILISRKTNNAAGFGQVYQTEVIKNTLDPIFAEISIKLEDICGGDVTAPVKFDFYDWDSIGKHDYIGTCLASVQDLLKPQASFNIINEKKQKKSSYKNSGVLKVFEAELFREYNFIEYLVGGCEVSLIVGIDCTGSNGEPSSPTSLHYQHPTQPNQYANAIVGIGNVLAPYDYDGMYPVYGFGGVVPGQTQVNHCFPMGLNPDTLYCRGVEGMLDCYYRNIKSIVFSGPTYFAPLIREAARQASMPTPTQQKYTILLIITDGEILDMDNTIDAIVEASILPFSIVIVGVGNANFDNMNQLDGDGGLLKSTRGQRAERDIVQFVPMRQFTTAPFGALASETLREIPGQFMAFMNKYKIKPNPPRNLVVQQQPPPQTTTATIPPPQPPQ